MLRRWGILLAMLTLTAGLTVAAGSASAATTGFGPGGPIHLVGTAAAAPQLRGGISHAGGKHELVRLRRHHRHVHQRLGELDRAHRHLQPGQPVLLVLGRTRRLLSSSVEQTGSDVDCSGRTPRYYAWYEMYPNPSVSYSNTVRPGDHFNASVTYTGSNHFSLFIQDATQGWSHTTTGTLANAARSSAEVIVEAPCCTAGGGILPLADFGTVSITGSLANGSALGNAGGVTQIVMVDSAGRDKDAVSSLSGGENFSATWLRSN